MQLILAAILLLFSGFAYAQASDPFPCSCTLMAPNWWIAGKVATYPQRFLVFETNILTLQTASVGEMWDKPAAARCSYSQELMQQLSAWQAWYGGLGVVTAGTALTLTPAQVDAMRALKSNTDTLVNAVKAQAAKP